MQAGHASLWIVLGWGGVILGTGRKLIGLLWSQDAYEVGGRTRPWRQWNLPCILHRW